MANEVGIHKHTPQHNLSCSCSKHKLKNGGYRIHFLLNAEQNMVKDECYSTANLRYQRNT